MTFFGLKKKKAQILVCGLDNSGKTSIINKLKRKKEQETDVVPTVGFTVHKIKTKDLNCTMFDMSGQGRYRSLWEHYYNEAEAVIFVFDTSDKLRICVVEDELDSLLQHPDLSTTPVLFFANKQDLPGAITEEECIERLGLKNIVNRPWYLKPSNAITGEGIHEGIEWLNRTLVNKKKRNQ
eukprot:gb/GECH01004414.1/.p1 GENE.gb/GECH01004414.1/~~gb/GECH01004414.1/.p1  ORF type:complete len:181 (+),score=33.18 gb/GECH01004414.1/:1-543(+)